MINNLLRRISNCRGINLIRQTINILWIKTRYMLGIGSKVPLKLHLGCGNCHLEGYINIDIRKTEATDIVCDIVKLPYPNNSIEVIESYHVIEHLPRHILVRALKEWWRVLVPGGKLIIECPNFDEVVKEYLEGNEKRLDSIFGLQRFPGDYHFFGYNFQRLKIILTQAGFTNICQTQAQDYHTKNEPCLRVECIKGGE